MLNKKRIIINDNFNMILNFINTSDGRVKFQDLLQFCIDYDLYKEFYLNFNIFCKLIDEHNILFEESKNLI